MSNNGWINTMGCIWTMKYYSATRRKEVLKCVSIWWTLENTILSEWATCKSPYIVWCHLHEMSSLGQSIETESGCMELRWDGGGQGREVRKGFKLKGMISLWDNENVLIDVGDKHNSVSILKATKLNTQSGWILLMVCELCLSKLLKKHRPQLLCEQDQLYNYQGSGEREEEPFSD